MKFKIAAVSCNALARVVFGTTLMLPLAAWTQQNVGIAPVTLTDGSYVFDSAEQHKIRVVVVVRGLNHPFAVAPLPNGDALVTERGLDLKVVRNVGASGTAKGGAPAKVEPVTGIAPLQSRYPNAGLHDIVLHPQFAQNRLVYFTFNEPAPPSPQTPEHRPSIISLWRGEFDGHALTHVQELFAAPPGGSTSGSRIAFGRDGSVYVTTGAPFGDEAQRLDNVYGKVLRLRDDGKVPSDNPFVGRDGARPEVYSYGHRDQLGLTVQPDTGVVLNAEHGPNGGDEVNVILPGRNYGWPKVSFGRNYDGTRIGDSPIAEGVEQPTVIWLPSIAPSGLTFYTGDRFPAWKGNLFVGSSRRGEVPRTGGLERVVFNDKLGELRRETLLTDLHQRIRDVRQGPDGLLYVVTDEDDGALLRIEPAG